MNIILIREIDNGPAGWEEVDREALTSQEAVQRVVERARQQRLFGPPNIRPVRFRALHVEVVDSINYGPYEYTPQ